MKPHAFQAEARAREEAVGVDALDGLARSLQLESWETWGSILGWFLVTLLALDASCNVLGLPFLSGAFLHVVARDWPDHLGWLTTLVWLTHAALTLLACFVLHRSPWRYWLPALYRDRARRENRAGEAWNWLAVNRTLFAILVVVCGGNLGLAIHEVAALDREQVMLLLGAGIAALGLAAPLWTVARRLLGSLDNATAVGLLLAVVVILTGVLHLRPRSVGWETHLRLVWSTRRLIALQWCDLLFCVSLLAAFLGVLAEGGFNPPRRLRLTPPVGEGQVVYRWEYGSLAVPPVIARPDPSVLSRLLFFREDPRRGQVLLRRGASLELTDGRVHTALDLGALARDHDLTAPSVMGDQAGFFQGKFRFHLHARTPEALGLDAPGRDEPGIDRRVFEAFLQALCLNGNPRLELEGVLARTLRAYVGELSGTARGYLERYHALFREARRLRLEETSLRVAGDALDHPDVGAPAVAIVGVEPLRAALEHVHARFDAVHAEWERVRELLPPAREVLPALFQEQLERWILGKASGSPDAARLDGCQLRDLRVLMECAGVSLIVDSFSLDPGAATQCEQMPATLEEREAAEIQAAEIRLAQNESTLIARRQEHWEKFSIELTRMLPVLGRNSVFVESFVKQFMGQRNRVLAELGAEGDTTSRERVARAMLDAADSDPRAAAEVEREEAF